MGTGLPHGWMHGGSARRTRWACPNPSPRAVPALAVRLLAARPSRGPADLLHARQPELRASRPRWRTRASAGCRSSTCR
jgi:hypothetical protein